MFDTTGGLDEAWITLSAVRDGDMRSAYTFHYVGDYRDQVGTELPYMTNHYLIIYICVLYNVLFINHQRYVPYYVHIYDSSIVLHILCCRCDGVRSYVRVLSVHNKQHLYHIKRKERPMWVSQMVRCPRADSNPTRHTVGIFRGSRACIPSVWWGQVLVESW